MFSALVGRSQIYVTEMGGVSRDSHRFKLVTKYLGKFFQILKLRLVLVGGCSGVVQ